MKRLIVDLDGTLTIDTPNVPYSQKRPNLELIQRLHEYTAEGFEVVVSTARNMRTYEGNIGKINFETLPTIIAWLDEHNVPYSEILVGKPWCGEQGFYIDDKAVRPNEFIEMSYKDIAKLLELKASKQ